VNRFHHALAALGITAVALAACGGGGGGSSTPKTATQPPAGSYQLNQATPQPTVANRTQVGTARLVLALPQIVTAQNAPASQAARAFRSPNALRKIAGLTRRTPAFVDPGYNCKGYSICQNKIDIIVDGELIPNLDGCAPNDTICVSPDTSNGTQNLQIPLYATNYDDIVVEEFDPCGNNCGDLIAMGGTWVQGFQPGTAVNATVTLQMNAAYIGILNFYNQNHPELMTGQNYYGLINTCGAPSIQAQFGLYTADGDGNFVPTAGYGGTSTPTETSTSDANSNTRAPQTTIPGLYLVAWDQSCGGVTVNASAPNPAYGISFDVLGPYPQDIIPEDGPRYYWSNVHGQQYSFGGPFITDANNNVYGTFGYYECAYNGESCPGGPYQAVWNQVWYYSPNSNVFGVLYGELFPPVVTGSVDIQAFPAVPIPSPSGGSGGVQSSPVPLPSTPGGSGGVSSSPIPI
jgi:hypothetical protein